MALNILECRGCDTSFWFETEHSGGIDGCPACFGHPVLDIESNPTATVAEKNYPSWQQQQLETMREVWSKHHPKVADHG